MEQMIPVFFEHFLSPRVVSTVSIVVHVILSVVKLTVGFAAGSAGLIADGADNTVDTISSFLVWLGIRTGRETLASGIIIAMMFVSVAGIGVAAYNKVVNVGPIREGLTALVVTAIAGLMMLALSVYQYAAGKKSGNFAILCQSVDSRNHFYTSLIVIAAVILSFLAERLGLSWLYYGDAVASIIIASLIFKEGLVLAIELVKPGGEGGRVGHFAERIYRGRIESTVERWVLEQLERGPLSIGELENLFAGDFCRETPRILDLIGVGYRPEDAAELGPHVRRLAEKGRIKERDGTYTRCD
jgi:hypothetical protein